MIDTNIPPGAYWLDRDVQNPRPDRRHTRDWRKMPWWTKGTQFVVKEQRRLGDRQLAEVTVGLDPAVVAELRTRDRYTMVELAGDSHAVLHRVGPGDEEQYAALAAALVPTEESLSQFMTRIDCENGFVEWLVETGAIQRADLERWWHRYQYGDDEPAAEPPSVVTLLVCDEAIELKPCEFPGCSEPVAPTGRPTPPLGEAPLLCEDCAQGCLGHQKRCESASCECPAREHHVPARYRSVERRAVALRESGLLNEDRSLVVAALRVAAEQYERDAEAAASTPRIRQGFRSQAIRCRIIADVGDR